MEYSTQLLLHWLAMATQRTIQKDYLQPLEGGQDFPAHQPQLYPTLEPGKICFNEAIKRLVRPRQVAHLMGS